jgi:BlaI family penicillinase repressor
MKRISDAELEVMKIIWSKKEITPLEIVKSLEKSPWSENTIRTLIKRLYDKGAVKVTVIPKRGHIYTALIDENQYKAKVTRDLINKLYNNSISEFVLNYCENEKLSITELKEIRDQIELYIKENKNSLQ